MTIGRPERSTEILTVGHSNHSSEAFVELLRVSGVTAVADVRSVPFSTRHPQFRKENLRASLKEGGVAYVFLGRELGARPRDRQFYVDGKVQYARIAASEAFGRGLDRVSRGARNHRIAMMCAEREPLDCHRMLLVSRHLIRRGVTVRHIHADGSLEDGRDAESRLVEAMGLAGGDLFAPIMDKRAIVDEAYRLRERRIGSVR